MANWETAVLDIGQTVAVECARVDLFWQERIRHFNAVPRKYGKEMEEQKDKAIYFETQNFGWILSPIDPTTGNRTVLLQY